MKQSTVAHSDGKQFSSFKNREHGSTTTRCKKLEEEFNLYLYAGLGDDDISQLHSTSSHSRFILVMMLR